MNTAIKTTTRCTACLLGFFLILLLAGCGQTGNTPEKPSEAGKNRSLPSALEEAGFGSIAKKVESMKRPCLMLLKAREEIKAPRGTSRIGGLPDLPHGVKWPKADGASLSFIAQINLTAFPDPARSLGLPAKGMLYFFYDPEQAAVGFDPRDRERWQVIYAPAFPDSLEEAEFPDDLPEDARFHPKVVAPTLETSYPDPYQCDLAEFGLNGIKEDAVIRIWDEFGSPAEGAHKMLGWPDPVQTDTMRLECQLASNGIYCEDASGYNDPRARELEPGASDWILLLQIDSDQVTGMMWGDEGKLFYWIRKQDLAEKKFENVWVVLQSY
jgi:uncharacterized protein YwqG